MNVIWRLPDRTVRETEIADIEQLLFILRMVTTTSINGDTYCLEGAELAVEDDSISIVVKLTSPLS